MQEYDTEISFVHLLQTFLGTGWLSLIQRINRGNNHKIHNCSKWGRRCFSCRGKTITHFTKLFQQQMNRLHMHYTNLLEIGQVHRSMPQDRSTILWYLMMQGLETGREPEFPFLQKWDDTRSIDNHGKFLLVLHRQRSLIYICSWTLPQLLFYAQFPELC